MDHCNQVRERPSIDMKNVPNHPGLQWEGLQSRVLYIFGPPLFRYEKRKKHRGKFVLVSVAETEREGRKALNDKIACKSRNRGDKGRRMLRRIG